MELRSVIIIITSAYIDLDKTFFLFSLKASMFGTKYSRIDQVKFVKDSL